MFREKYTERWEVERKKKKLFIHRYNIIPEKALKSPILEVGAGEGLRQIECKHKDVFLKSDYLGIDLLKPIKSELNIIQADILSSLSICSAFLTIAGVFIVHTFTLGCFFFTYKTVLIKLKPLAPRREQGIERLPTA